MDKAPEDEYVIEVRGSDPLKAAFLAQALDALVTFCYKGRIKIRTSRTYNSYPTLHEDHIPENVFLTVEKKNAISS